ncbi:MAG: DUF1223 domain-containing protein [Parvularculaceae bacterium]
MSVTTRSGLAGTAAVLCAVAAGLAAPADARDDPAETAKPGAVVVEMFLSQACNACPPAAALMPALAQKPGVIALSWHIDYWNMTDSPHGRWVDPYSSAAYSERQRRYNLSLRKRSSVYTPQAVVNGVGESVGSSLEKISTLIASTAPAARVDAMRDDKGLRFKVGETEKGGNAYLVTFRRHAATRITAGENFGKTFDEINIVTDVKPLGTVRRRGGALKAPAPAAGDGCAVIVQEPKQQRIVAAGLCPA